jgi:hypothetical protein
MLCYIVAIGIILIVFGCFGIIGGALDSEWLVALVLGPWTALAGAWLIWTVYQDRHTEFTAERLARPTLRGTVRLRWDELTRAKIREVPYGYRQMHLTAGSAKLMLPLAYRRHPRLFVAEMKQRTPRGAWSAWNDAHLDEEAWRQRPV